MVLRVIDIVRTNPVTERYAVYILYAHSTLDLNEYNNNKQQPRP